MSFVASMSGTAPGAWPRRALAAHPRQLRCRSGRDPARKPSTRDHRPGFYTAWAA